MAFCFASAILKSLCNCKRSSSFLATSSFSKNCNLTLSAAASAETRSLSDSASFDNWD